MEDFFLHYCLIEKLATKTLRTTYLAYPLREKQKKIIIKIYDPECVNQDQQGGASRVDSLMSLEHPHIVPVLDIALEQGKPYVVSEYRAQGSLNRHLERLKRLKHKPMVWPEALNIVSQIGQALSYAHQHGVIHGNIKPENIFYRNNGAVQLTDFHLSPFIDVTKLGYKADLATTRYMAPEQFVGKTEKASDQYALACLAYELLTGRVPFDAQSFSSMWGKHTNDYAAPLTSYVKVPMSIDVAILRALAKKSEDRHEDMDAFLFALENAFAPPSPEPSLELSSSISTDPDAVKKSLITKPFGFTPFPQGPEDLELSTPASVLADLDTQEQASLLAIDPPSLSGLRTLSEGRKPVSDAAALVGRDDIDVPSSDAAAQVTNPLPEVEVEQHVRPYGQLIQVADRVTASQHKIITEPSREDRTAVVISAPVEPQRKRGSRKRFVFWISAISVALILLGVLIPYLLNISSSSQQVRTGIQPSVNSDVNTDVNTTARAVPDSRATTIAAQSTPIPATSTHSSIPSHSVTPASTARVTPTSIVPAAAPSHSSHATAPAATPTIHGAGSVQINTGGGSSGSFVADEDFTSPIAGRPSSSSSTNNAIDTSGVVDPAPESVYQTNRVGDSIYTIPNLTAGASYTVRLHFAETYWTTVGHRVFNVSLNGQTVLSNFDIVAAAGGGDKAVVEQFVTKPTSDDTITLQFLTVHDNAQINGIEVLAN